MANPATAVAAKPVSAKKPLHATYRFLYLPAIELTIKGNISPGGDAWRDLHLRLELLDGTLRQNIRHWPRPELILVEGNRYLLPLNPLPELLGDDRKPLQMTIEQELERAIDAARPYIPQLKSTHHRQSPYLKGAHMKASAFAILDSVD